jgi:hypothetical protein
LTDDRPDGGVRVSARGSAGGLKTDTIALELSPEWEDEGSEGSSTSLFWTKDRESGNVSDKKNEVQKPIAHQVSKELDRISILRPLGTGMEQGTKRMLTMNRTSSLRDGHRSVEGTCPKRLSHSSLLFAARSILRLENHLW